MRFRRFGLKFSCQHEVRDGSRRLSRKSEGPPQKQVCAVVLRSEFDDFCVFLNSVWQSIRARIRCRQREVRFWPIRRASDGGLKLEGRAHEISRLEQRRPQLVSWNGQIGPHLDRFTQYRYRLLVIIE